MLEASFLITQGLFIKAIGFIYLVAFFSLSRQVLGLYGSQGIQPIQYHLNSQSSSKPFSVWLKFPTLFWICHSDSFLKNCTFVGIALSLLVIIGMAPALCLALLWMLYFSFYQVGSPFLNFQWDALLIEVGFVTIPFALITPAPPLLFFLLWFLLFRFFFASGYTKLAIGSRDWRTLTALEHHFETQPLPTPLSYYIHQYAKLLSKPFVIGVYIVEIFVPFLIFFPEPMRHIAFWTLVIFQCFIIMTGNYAFFNLLSIALTLSLLEDSFLSFFAPFASFQALPASLSLWYALSIWGGVWLFLNILEWVSLFSRSAKIQQILFPFKKYSLINSYGLFIHMTTIRNEIVIEGSNDQQKWFPYVFYWKPQDLLSPPSFVAPHQPRIDWQMWFSALRPYHTSDWLTPFLYRLLQGSPEVLKLLKTNPFPEKPPKYIRCILYRYHFTTLKEKQKTKAWWKQIYLGKYSPALSLPDMPNS